MGHQADTASYYWTTFLRLDPKLATAFGVGPVAIIDLPWIPLFLAICFLIHPWLGMVTLARMPK